MCRPTCTVVGSYPRECGCCCLASINTQVSVIQRNHSSLLGVLGTYLLLVLFILCISVQAVIW